MREFQNGEQYHVFNRGVEKRAVFQDEADYRRFLASIQEFNTIVPVGSLRDVTIYNEAIAKMSIQRSNRRMKQPLVKIIAYCLNSNHYHLILEQLVDNGISEFVKRLAGGYTGYFNKKYDRTGALFQGRFKSSFIGTNERLLYLSVYVNQNHYIHGYKEREWLYSSLLEYQDKKQNGLCDKEVIMEQFDNNFADYVKFMNSNVEYLKNKKEFSKLILE